MTRSEHLTEADLEAVATEFGVDARDDTNTPEDARSARDAARERVEADERSSHASGVRMTPRFFINGRHYYGSWDEADLAAALVGSLGPRIRVRALPFARLAPAG